MTWKKVVLFCVIIGIMAFSVADIQYRDERKEKYLAEAEVYEALLAKEKDWIRKNQGENGEIYLNRSDSAGKSGSVNPYFACQAGMGLMVGDVSEEDLHCVASYLSWHTKQLIEAEGEICNYRMKDGVLYPTGKMDSVDSYIAVFLTLLCEYVEQGGSVEQIDQWQEAVKLSFHKLQSITENQLTWVAGDRRFSYLMDNAEVWEACDRMAKILASNVTFWDSPQEKKRYAELFAQAAKEYRSGIEKWLWNPGENRYEIGRTEAGDIFQFHGWDVLYPDAVAQIYPMACGLFLGGNSRGEQLYHRFCEQYDWQHLQIPDEFPWPVFAYIAVELHDVDSAETYLETYHNQYKDNRHYPLHTADAGWAARAWGELISHCKAEAGKGLLYALMAR